MTKHIFVSYSKKDSEKVYLIENDLQAAGFRTWIDRSIGGGDDWRKAIEKNLKDAGDVIVMVSTKSMASNWVLHEGSLAYGWNKRIIPVLIENVDALPPWMEEYQWIDFVNKPYEAALDELKQTLTPPNPIQDLLDMQVATYSQTGELMSEAVLRVIEEARDNLKIEDTAEKFIQESRAKVSRDKKASRLRTAILAVFFVVSIVLVTLGVTGQLNKFIYRPLEMAWVEIPAGEFSMGITDEQVNQVWEQEPGYDILNETPQHRVYLDAFFIGKYEVTNKQYSQCVRADVCNPPTDNEFFGETGFDNYPIVGVNWEDAQIFCEWNVSPGGHLPTEAEWEKAARGDKDNRTYPWGDQWDPSKANVNVPDSGSLKPVGSYSPSGDSIYGIADMSGNAWEWAQDWYDYYKNSDEVEVNPQGPDGGDYRVLRGGSYQDREIEARSTYRLPYVPAFVYSDIGFRCVQEVEK